MHLLNHMNQLLSKLVIAVLLFGFQWPAFSWAKEFEIPLIENYDIKIEASKFAFEIHSTSVL
jgi:hypothetical protein